MSPETKQMVKDKDGGLSGALKGMGGDGRGDYRQGFIGGNALRKKDYVPEPEILSLEETERKQIVFDLLMKLIVPNELSAKSNPRLDKKSLASKLQKTTLAGLMEFLPDWFKEVPTNKLGDYLSGEEEISDADLSYVQDMYKDISP